MDLHDVAGEGFGVDMTDTLMGETALTAACLSGSEDTVVTLLDRGGALDSSNNRGMPPLLCAAKAGQWQIVDLLLNKGAPLEQMDKHGRTSIMIAAAEGHLGVLDMLLAKGRHFGSPKQRGTNYKSVFIHGISRKTMQSLSEQVQARANESCSEGKFKNVRNH